MDKYRIQKSVPLKVFVHILMALAFFAAAVCCEIYIRVTEIRGTGVVETMTPAAEDSYFSSSMFLSEYGKQLDYMYIGLAAIDSGENNGYYLSSYVAADKNFQYAVYDVEGQRMYVSKGWNASAINLSDAKYYYTVDLRHLHLFAIDSIRNVAYSRDFSQSDADEKAERTQDADMVEETEINAQTEAVEGAEALLPSDVVSGNVEYGSNFTKYTHFYSCDETVLARHIGYICTYVPETLVEGDAFYEGYQTFNQLTKWGRLAPVCGGAAVLTALACLLFLISAAGHSHQKDGIYLYAFDRWYTDVFIAITAVISVIISILLEAVSAILMMTYGIAPDDRVYAVFRCISVYGVSVFVILSLSRRIKVHRCLKHSLACQLCSGLYAVISEGFVQRRPMRKYILFLLGLGIFNFVLIASVFCVKNSYWILFVCMIYFYEWIYISIKLLAVQKIREGAEKIAGGDLEYKIDASHMHGLFKALAEDINNIGNGLNMAVEESIRSERMKADLITNVSHDIKTPLTSIINYVDLLKREHIQEEPIREYIEVLDMKSQRLKELTEDLVEASRASSGNIHLEISRINLVELVSQAMGNYQEKFDSKGLTPVIGAEEEKLMILADGRRLYRVLDNLFSNTFKYAMADSRVYIDTYSRDRKAYFVMKNISGAPLNISPEELTQRFVRGDASRTTEGSGLGLSIAQSLTELHGGTFEIYLDGDLFKVILSFEISVEV